MDETFLKLKQEKNNSVDTCVMWFQNSKLIDNSEEAQDKARELFADVKDKDNVELEKFKEVVCRLAEEQKKTIEDFTVKLADTGPRILNAIMVGASAFKEALSKK